jgi:vancomycin resistance protein YoaR
MLERLRHGGALACLLIAGALGGLAWSEHAAAIAPRPMASAVIVLEAPVTSTESSRAAAERIAAAWGAVPFTLRVGDDTSIATRAEMGAGLDVAALTAALDRARDPDSLMIRHHLATHGDAPLALPVEVQFDPSSTLALLLDRKDHLDVRAESARMRPRTGEVVPGRRGRTLDVFGSLDAVHAALVAGGREVEAVIVDEAPHRTAEELEGIRTATLLGFFETRYSTLETSTDRTYNLRVAVERIDGLVVMPGETFDFNDVVGPRSEANGFRPAPEIAGGELVDGVGGGTCQVAGTLHAAVFFAGLPVVERRPHSRPSSYLWMGLDATVVYPNVDFRFRNDRSFPLVLGFTLEGGVARAEIRGAETNSLVTFTRRVDETLAFPIREEEDASLPAGVRVLSQRGVPGFRISWFRTDRDLSTNSAHRIRGEDAYPPTTEIWRVGTGPEAGPDFVAPPGDTHLPYSADSYLVASEGPSVDGMAVTRR